MSSSSQGCDRNTVKAKDHLSLPNETSEQQEDTEEVSDQTHARCTLTRTNSVSSISSCRGNSTSTPQSSINDASGEAESAQDIPRQEIRKTSVPSPSISSRNSRQRTRASTPSSRSVTGTGRGGKSSNTHGRYQSSETSTSESPVASTVRTNSQRSRSTERSGIEQRTRSRSRIEDERGLAVSILRFDLYLAHSDILLELHIHSRVIRDSGKDGSPKQYTEWFETQSDTAILVPPKLHKQSGVEAGDLFLHRYPGTEQLWLRVLDDDTGGDVWKAVDIGYEREDGRKLTITPSTRKPSWVSSAWGARRISAGELSVEYMILDLIGSLDWGC